MATNPFFDAAFNKVCSEFSVPGELQKRLHQVILNNRNNSKAASKLVVEILPHNWKHGSITPVLLGEKKPDFSEEHIFFLVSRVLSLTSISETWERIQKAKKLLPNLLLISGSRIQECPVHKNDIGKIIAIDDEYWKIYPLREHLSCSCSVRTVSDFELNNPR